MKFARRRRTPPVITIVSLIDILTILLIFCIVTTTFKTQDQAVQINLPESKVIAKDKQAEANPAILAITKDGVVYLEGKTITMEEVGASVKKLQEDKRPVGLKVDEEAPVKRMFEVLDSLKLAGVQSLPAFTREKSR